MKIFFERRETDDEIVVVHKPYFMYFFIAVMAVVLVTTNMPENPMASIASIVLLFILGGVLVVRFFSMRGCNKEVIQAMKQGKVEMSGSKLSPSQPLTFRIKKAEAA